MQICSKFQCYTTDDIECFLSVDQQELKAMITVYLNVTLLQNPYPLASFLICMIHFSNVVSFLMKISYSQFVKYYITIFFNFSWTTITSESQS
jgi:hypothetical protein